MGYPSGSPSTDTTDTTDITIVDNDAKPGLKVDDVSTPSAHPARGLTFRIALNRQSSKAITVRWTTANGSATAGSDCVAASGTLTFAPGQTLKTVAVQIKGDRTSEPNETMFVTISQPTSSVIGDANGSGLIRNDD